MLALSSDQPAPRFSSCYLHSIHLPVGSPVEHLRPEIWELCWPCVEIGTIRRGVAAGALWLCTDVAWDDARLYAVCKDRMDTGSMPVLSAKGHRGCVGGDGERRRCGERDFKCTPEARAKAFPRCGVDQV